MTRKTRSFRPSPALVISCLALFVALTGSAFAAGVLGKNTVRSPQIVDGGVRTVDLHDEAVSSTKIATDAVGSNQIAKDAVRSDQIAGNAVGTDEIAPETISHLDLANDSVGSTELQASAVRASELGPIIEVHNQTTIKGGGNASVDVNCPGGTTVISGGALGGFYQVAIAGSFRANNGWHVDARSSANDDTTLTGFAYCLVGGGSN